MRPTIVRALLLLGLLSSPAFAQINTATISGTIKDETGGCPAGCRRDGSKRRHGSDAQHSYGR